MEKTRHSLTVPNDPANTDGLNFVSGYMIGVNPFDQPGVEAYKKNMFALLGKPGYENMREALETRQDIAEKLSLSMPTTLQYVTRLIETGILEECGAAQSNGGRKAKILLLRFLAGMRAVIHRYYPEVDAFTFQKGCYAYAACILEQGPPEKPGVKDILTFFRNQGVKLAVASSSYREMVQKNLRAAGIEGFFDTVISGDEVVHGKPEPDIFLLAARRLNCLPEDCYVFEDGINGVRAGIAAGCAAVMIPDLFPSTEELRKGCAGIYSNLCEAMQAIEANHL